MAIHTLSKCTPNQMIPSWHREPSVKPLTPQSYSDKLPTKCVALPAAHTYLTSKEYRLLCSHLEDFCYEICTYKMYFDSTFIPWYFDGFLEEAIGTVCIRNEKILLFNSIFFMKISKLNCIYLIFLVSSYWLHFLTVMTFMGHRQTAME